MSDISQDDGSRPYEDPTRPANIFDYVMLKAAGHRMTGPQRNRARWLAELSDEGIVGARITLRRMVRDILLSPPDQEEQEIQAVEDRCGSTMNRDLEVSKEGMDRVRGRCVVTGQPYSVVVPLSGAIDYFERGRNIAEAFPDLPKPEREFLISGTSPEGVDTAIRWSGDMLSLLTFQQQ